MMTLAADNNVLARSSKTARTRADKRATTKPVGAARADAQNGGTVTAAVFVSGRPC